MSIHATPAFPINSLLSVQYFRRTPSIARTKPPTVCVHTSNRIEPSHPSTPDIPLNPTIPFHSHSLAKYLPTYPPHHHPHPYPIAILLLLLLLLTLTHPPPPPPPPLSPKSDHVNLNNPFFRDQFLGSIFMVWYGMVWNGMEWNGLVWNGMVWYGMVWYGMVWNGRGEIWVFLV